MSAPILQVQVAGLFYRPATDDEVRAVGWVPASEVEHVKTAAEAYILRLRQLLYAADPDVRREAHALVDQRSGEWLVAIGEAVAAPEALSTRRQSNEPPG